MDFLGVGPLEFFFIIIIALIIFGPNDIVKAARSLGSFMRRVVTSDSWRAFQQASRGMKDIPTTLMREAGLEEEELRRMTGITDLENATKDFDKQISPWTTPPATQPDNPEDPADAPAPEVPPQPENEPSPAAPPPDSPFPQTIDNT